jgi:hypothetical protein
MVDEFLTLNEYRETPNTTARGFVPVAAIH